MPKCRECGDELDKDDWSTVCRACIWAEVAYDHEEREEDDG